MNSGDRFTTESVSAFFVFIRLTGRKLFFRTQASKPFPENKNGLRDFVGHPKGANSIERFFLPEYTPTHLRCPQKGGENFLYRIGAISADFGLLEPRSPLFRKANV
ncbi:MAG: hypothetical protein IJA67_13705 [Oscillospiraceae bacterium]|nr:hypothetical protein [Oscillospiraceae bacterium]